MTGNLTDVEVESNQRKQTICTVEPARICVQQQQTTKQHNNGKKVAILALLQRRPRYEPTLRYEQQRRKKHAFVNYVYDVEEIKCCLRKLSSKVAFAKVIGA